MTLLHRLVLALSVFGLAAATCVAQDGDTSPVGKKIGVKHITPRAQDLPPPGAPMKLSFQLTNTREITQVATALITLDGRLMNVLAAEGYMNEYDLPTFEVATIAPLSDLAYQLVVRGQDGSIATSPRYAVQRSCLPRIDLTSVAIPESIQGRERLGEVIEKTKGLERDLGFLEQSLRTAKTLKGMLEDE
jgi:hypothetical protein